MYKYMTKRYPFKKKKKTSPYDVSVGSICHGIFGLKPRIAKPTVSGSEKHQLLYGEDYDGLHAQPSPATPSAHETIVQR